jgi:hypothetical protein
MTKLRVMVVCFPYFTDKSITITQSFLCHLQSCALEMMNGLDLQLYVLSILVHHPLALVFLLP